MSGGGPANIAVVRALAGMGDMLCAIPALDRLRAAFPNARISFIGLPQVEKLLARYPGLIDRFVAFPGFPGMSEAPFDAARLASFLDDQRTNARYDLAIQLHGDGNISNIFTALLGARRTVGFHLPGLWAPEAATACPWPTDLAEPLRLLKLMDVLGFGDGAPPMRFPVSDADHAEAEALIAPLAGQRFAVLHAGASNEEKRWPTDRFAAVGEALAARGYAVVLSGVPSEAAATAALRDALAIRPLDLTGRCPLGPTAVLLQRASLVVTNDTGISHLAAAVGARSVVIFMAADPGRWSPTDAGLHRPIGVGVPDHRPNHPPHGVAPSAPDVADVMAAIDAQLAVAA